MIPWMPVVNDIYKYLTSGSSKAAQPIHVPSVEIHDIETAAEKRPRTLKHLIKANHVNHAILYHDSQFCNHMPHILGSAYMLGANADQLNHIYGEESKELEDWKDSPGEITDSDWREYLGNTGYQRAYVDFFEDELALKYGYKWKKVVDEFLFSGKNPIVNGLIGNRTSPKLCV